MAAAEGQSISRRRFVVMLGNFGNVANGKMLPVPIPIANERRTTMTKKQAGVIAVIAVPAAAVVLTAVVFSLYLFFGGFDDAAEASLDDADLIVKLAD